MTAGPMAAMMAVPWVTTMAEWRVAQSVGMLVVDWGWQSVGSMAAPLVKRRAETSVWSMADASADPTGQHWGALKAARMADSWVVSLVGEKVVAMAVWKASSSVGEMEHWRVDQWVFPMGSTMAAMSAKQPAGQSVGSKVVP